VDRETFAAKAAAVERHLQRVGSRLPPPGAVLEPASDVSDAVVLHLWQAVQLVLDIALGSCPRLGLPVPRSYGEALDILAGAGRLPRPLAERLVKAVAFRNRVAHVDENLDLAVVAEAAREGPADLRAFLSHAAAWFP
jgi:uncharacterized protein YutE (UPF0331/DUF86 family)